MSLCFVDPDASGDGSAVHPGRTLHQRFLAFRVTEMPCSQLIDLK